MAVTPTDISTAEGLAGAGDIGRCELVRGTLIRRSPAGSRHGVLAARLGAILFDWVDRHQLGVVFAAETGFVLERNPDTVRAPDVAFVTPDRANLIARRGFFPGPPDLAVEVLSPDDTASELLDKVNDWLRAGTRSVWLVDGERRTVTIYRSDAPLSRLAGEDTLTDDLLPGLSLPLSRIFG